MDNAKHYSDADIALIDARCKSNTHRIDELQEHQTALDRLATERATEPDCSGTVHWLREVEDAKGMKTKDYLLKKKLMQDKYGITIREV